MFFFFFFLFTARKHCFRRFFNVEINAHDFRAEVYLKHCKRKASSGSSDGISNSHGSAREPMSLDSSRRVQCLSDPSLCKSILRASAKHVRFHHAASQGHEKENADPREKSTQFKEYTFKQKPKKELWVDGPQLSQNLKKMAKLSMKDQNYKNV